MAARARLLLLAVSSSSVMERTQIKINDDNAGLPSSGALQSTARTAAAWPGAGTRGRLCRAAMGLLTHAMVQLPLASGSHYCNVYDCNTYYRNAFFFPVLFSFFFLFLWPH